jgi:hypothetical protein
VPHCCRDPGEKKEKESNFISKYCMPISSRVKRLLLAKSGGYCQNPACNSDIYQYFENGEINSIEELAHIIAQQDNGPRGTTNEEINDRDEYANLLVLCPSCHTMVDKSPEQFPVSMLRNWKTNHEDIIKACFHVPRYQQRSDLKRALTKLLSENKATFDQYGPQSEYAGKTGQSEASTMWTLKSVETIIPNNRKIIELVEKNYALLNQEETEIIAKFKIHKEGFEYNKLSGDKNPTVPTFPTEIIGILQ